MIRNKVTVDDEKNIITSMIVSDEFIKRIMPIVRPEYFQVPYAKTVFYWLKDYFEKYNKAPGRHIQDLYRINKPSMDEDQAKLIDAFLVVLDEQYDESFNIDFYYDKAVYYLRQQAVIEKSREIKSLAEFGNIDDAEKAIMNFNKVMKATSGMDGPNEDESLDEYFVAKRKNDLLEFPGGLGKLFGLWKREWLVMGQGVYGSGKTWFLNMIRNLAIRQRVRVVDFNFEMNKWQYLERYYKSITQTNEEGGIFLIPVFDCLRNQLGDCNKTERTCNSRIRRTIQDPKPKFADAPSNYLPCTACADDTYPLETWFVSEERPPGDEFLIRQKIRSIKKGHDFVRFKCYPRGVASTNDICHDLDVLDYTEGFIPDIIIVDYLDIMAPSKNNNDNEETKLNQISLDLAWLAKERHAMVITVSQVKSSVVERGRGRHGKMGDASGSARAKYAHPDFAFSLMQTDEEKEAGIVRVNVVKSRERYFNERNEVILLQQLEIGMPIVDSKMCSILRSE